LEEPPISLRKALQEFADFEVIAGHGADLGHQFLANVFGDGLLVHLGGEVVAALGGVLMEGPLKELEGVLDLAFELFLAEAKKFGWLAHVYAYYYAPFKASKSACQEANLRISAKRPPQELNCYGLLGYVNGSFNAQYLTSRGSR
jgi:hypothetical protein